MVWKLRSSVIYAYAALVILCPLGISHEANAGPPRVMQCGKYRMRGRLMDSPLRLVLWQNTFDEQVLPVPKDCPQCRSYVGLPVDVEAKVINRQGMIEILKIRGGLEDETYFSQGAAELLKQQACSATKPIIPDKPASALPGRT